MALPVAQIISKSTAQTKWLVSWPSTMTKCGKSYYATTYPGSELVFLETAAKRRPVSSIVARKVLIEVKAAIERAGS